MNTSALKVAVIGASGIGKNHARWFHQHGCDVVAFVGSGPESVARTHKVLQDGFGFSGRGYDSVEGMLGEARPDIVCISSPPALHFEQALQCFRHNAHVLCEKPLVYDASLSPQELIAQSDQMVQAAAEAKVLLGTQMQYAVAVATLLELAGIESVNDIRSFSMEMETVNLKVGRDYELIWIDLSPHPLSVLQVLSGGGEIEASSIACEVRRHETAARFGLWPSGVQAEIVVRFNPDRPAPLRCFKINGTRIDYSGRKDASGAFWTYLSTEDGREIQMPDFVDSLVANLIAAVRGEQELLVPGTMGAQNVAWQWQLLQAAQRA